MPDPVLEYWAQILERTPLTPEVMTRWKRVLDQGVEAWSRALSEVMATEEFAQLLGASIEQWLAVRTPVTLAKHSSGGPAEAETTTLTAQLSRLEERLRRLEERLDRALSRLDDAPRPASRRRTAKHARDPRRAT